VIGTPEVQAAFQGDNAQIAYTSQQDDPDLPDTFRHVRVVNPDGSGDAPVATGPNDAEGARWSPDGSKLVYYRTTADGYRIYTAQADGSGETLVSLGLDPGMSDIQPGWSADGSQIVFSSDRDGDQDLWIMDADGSDPTRLTNHADNDQHASWSPDGSKIVFVRFGIGPRTLMVIDPDGSDETPLSVDNGDSNPDWSPDGQSIVFDSNRGGSTAVWRMDADGGNPVQLSPDDGRTYLAPAYSPDGTMLVWVVVGSDQDPIYALGVASADGTQGELILELDSAPADPDWGPATVAAPPAPTPPKAVEAEPDFTG
jgi:Tol biopolymer transport system component